MICYFCLCQMGSQNASAGQAGRPPAATPRQESVAQGQAKLAVSWWFRRLIASRY